MDGIIFANLDTYPELYEYAAQQPRAKNEVVDYLVDSVGKVRKTVNLQMKSVEDGKISFLSMREGQVIFDHELFEKVVSELCQRFGYEVMLEKKSKKRHVPEDDVPTVKGGHSPQYQAMKEKADSVDALVREYEQQLAAKDKAILEKDSKIAEMLLYRDRKISELTDALQRKVDDQILECMDQKVLVVGTMEIKPEEKAKRDFFLLSKPGLLDVDDLMSRNGGQMESPYRPIFSADKELSVENYDRKISRSLFGGKLLRRKAEEQERLSKVLLEETEDGSWVKRKNISLSEIEKNRLESINEIISMEGVTNQVKLSLYAAWCDKADPRVQDILKYAGEHDINAEYLIRLLEKPKEYHNVRSLWGMVMQAQMASEAHIKREAAMELISGDWYVEAMYGNKICKFQMVPVTELEEFYKALSEHRADEARQILGEVLSRKYIDEPDAEEQIAQAPNFIHELMENAGVDYHTPIDEDSFDDGFGNGGNASGK